MNQLSTDAAVMTFNKLYERVYRIHTVQQILAFTTSATWIAEAPAMYQRLNTEVKRIARRLSADDMATINAYFTAQYPNVWQHVA